MKRYSQKSLLINQVIFNPYLKLALTGIKRKTLARRPSRNQRNIRAFIYKPKIPQQ